MTAAHFPTHQAAKNAVAQVSRSSSKTWIKNCMALYEAVRLSPEVFSVGLDITNTITMLIVI
jgi:hypothetical protein